MTQLRRIRLERKLTLRSIGEIIKVTPQTVHDTEVYGIKTVKTAKRYAAALNCDWRELLDDGESAPSDLSDQSDTSDKNSEETHN